MNEIKYNLAPIHAGMLSEILQSSVREGPKYYIMQLDCTISANFSFSLFYAAFQKILNKYEILSAHLSKNGSYHFVIQEDIRILPIYRDYSDLDSDQKMDLVRRYLSIDKNLDFELTTAPLMRLACLKLEDNEYKLIWTIHHLLMDAQAYTAILLELFKIYNQLLQGKVEEITRVKYANLQDNLSCNFSQNDDERDYWRNLLSNYSNAAFLPAQQKTNKKGFDFYEITLSENDFLNLNSFIKKHNFTANSILQSIWGIILSIYSRKRYTLFGTVRAYPKDIRKNNIGLFINTLPILLDVDPNLSVLSYIKQMLEQNKSIRKYFNANLSNIKMWANLEIKDSLYSSVIDYKPYSIGKLLRENFNEIKSVNLSLNIPYAIVIEIVNDGTGISIKFNYDTSKFRARYIKNIAEHFSDILSKIINEECNFLTELLHIRKSDYKKIIYDWNDNIVHYPLDKKVNELFEEQVCKNPTNIALIYNDTNLTYQSLNEKANQLAHYLINVNVQREDFIAIYMKPKPERMIAILAVLKAGAAYVPIDPSYPVERKKYLLKDCGAKVIIFYNSGLETDNSNFLNESSYNVINLSCLNNELNNLPITNPILNESFNSRSLAYVIYTSGSTGLPKGVMVEHISLVNITYACIEKLCVNSNSRILQISSFGFDVSVIEWTMALLSGGSVCLIDQDIFNPQAIVDVMRLNKITLIILASTILNKLPRENLPDLKTVAPGGEVCSKNTLDFWAKDRLLVNIYGITETCICSTGFDYNKAINKLPSNIGKPLNNVKIYILDNDMKLVPIGVPGEIYVGGVVLARGYLNKENLTKDKFVDVILAEDIGVMRLYRTGDIGKWLYNGDIEYIGRSDEQVKINGHRIEISEIESLIEKFDTVDKAAVVAQTSNNYAKLYAYIVVNRTNFSINSLNQFLVDRLPYYMIPNEIKILDQMPLTPNGKVDKKQLMLNSGNGFIESQRVKLSKPVKQKKLVEDILNLIKNLLGVSKIEEHSTFSNMGFNSLSLIDLAERLNNMLVHTKITIIDLFSYNNVHSLSKYINSKRKA